MSEDRFVSFLVCSINGKDGKKNKKNENLGTKKFAVAPRSGESILFHDPVGVFEVTNVLYEELEGDSSHHAGQLFVRYTGSQAEFIRSASEKDA